MSIDMCIERSCIELLNTFMSLCIDRFADVFFLIGLYLSPLVLVNALCLDSIAKVYFCVTLHLDPQLQAYVF